jgi:hypothetical protein
VKEVLLESKPILFISIVLHKKNVTKLYIRLELMHRTEYIDQKQFDSMNNDAVELLKINTASIITAKKTLNH